MSQRKGKHRRPTPTLSKLITVMDKLAHYRATHRANVLAGATSDERFMAELSIEDCTLLIELIEALRTDPNLVDRYWLKGSMFPLTKPVEKLSAAAWAAMQTSPGKRAPADDAFEKAVELFKLGPNTGPDAAKHAYREYVRPRLGDDPRSFSIGPRITKRAKGQSEK